MSTLAGTLAGTMVGTMVHWLVQLTINGDIHWVQNNFLPLDIAASAYGRDFLSSSSEGQSLVSAMCAVLRSLPSQQQWYGDSYPSAACDLNSYTCMCTLAILFVAQE